MFSGVTCVRAWPTGLLHRQLYSSLTLQSTHHSWAYMHSHAPYAHPTISAPLHKVLRQPLLAPSPFFPRRGFSTEKTDTNNNNPEVKKEEKGKKIKKKRDPYARNTAAEKKESTDSVKENQVKEKEDSLNRYFEMMKKEKGELLGDELDEEEDFEQEGTKGKGGKSKSKTGKDQKGKEPKRQLSDQEIIEKYGEKKGQAIINTRKERERIKNMYGKWDPQKKITRDQMNELRQLRKEDPKTWTIQKLSERYKISYTAVKKILHSKWQPSEERAKEQDAKKLERASEYTLDRIDKSIELLNRVLSLLKENPYDEEGQEHLENITVDLLGQVRLLRKRTRARALTGSPDF